MTAWTSVRISKAALARLKAQAEAAGMSGTDHLHRLIEAWHEAPVVPSGTWDNGVGCESLTGPRHREALKEMIRDFGTSPSLNRPDYPGVGFVIDPTLPPNVIEGRGLNVVRMEITPDYSKVPALSPEEFSKTPEAPAVTSSPLYVLQARELEARSKVPSRCPNCAEPGALRAPGPTHGKLCVWWRAA